MTAGHSYGDRGYDPQRSFWGQLGERFGLVSMRPKLVEDIRIRRVGDEVELVQRSTGRVIPLEENDVRVVRQFDGTRSIAEMIVTEMEAGGKLEIEPVLALVDRVMRAEMLLNFPPNMFRQIENHLAHKAVALVRDNPLSQEELAAGMRAGRDLLAEAGIKMHDTEQSPWRPRTPLLAERAQFLRSVELLRSLDLYSLGALAEAAHEEAFPAAHNIVTEGEPAERFYIVRSGEANVTKRDEDGKPRRIAKLVAGDWFGEAGILDNRARNASVRVSPSRPVQALSFDANIFEKIISPHIDAFRGRQTLGKRRERLGAIPLFDSLAGEDLERLAEAVKELHVPAQTVVFRQGEQGDRFFVIISGAVGVVRDGVPVAKLIAGDFFGETALLFTNERTATVATTEESTFWTIDQPAFQRMVRAHLMGRRDMMPTVLNRLHPS